MHLINMYYYYRNYFSLLKEIYLEMSYPLSSPPPKGSSFRRYGLLDGVVWLEHAVSTVLLSLFDLQ